MHGEREKPGWGDSPWGAKAGGACSTLLTCSSQLSAYVEACARVCLCVCMQSTKVTGCGLPERWWFAIYKETWETLCNLTLPPIHSLSIAKWKQMTHLCLYLYVYVYLYWDIKSPSSNFIFLSVSQKSHNHFPSEMPHIRLVTAAAWMEIILGWTKMDHSCKSLCGQHTCQPHALVESPVAVHTSPSEIPESKNEPHVC